MSVWIYEDSHLQSMEYVNEVSKVLHNMNVTWQCITSVYHPQSNGFLNNRILMEVLDGNICDWPNITKGFFLHVGLANILQQNFHHSFLCIIGSLVVSSSILKGVKVNILSTKKRLIPSLHLRSPWEQTYIAWLVKRFVRHKKNNIVIKIDAIKCLTRSKWVKKCFWRIREGWTENAEKSLAHCPFIQYHIRNFVPQ